LQKTGLHNEQPKWWGSWKYLYEIQSSLNCVLDRELDIEKKFNFDVSAIKKCTRARLHK